MAHFNLPQLFVPFSLALSFLRGRSIKTNNLEIHRAEPAVIELNGFLNALRCVIDCPKRIFSATLVEKNADLNSIVEDTIKSIGEFGKLIEQRQSDYNTTYQLFIDHIYKKISDTKTRALDNLDWNLIEYYGLISTSDQEDGPWNRFISQEHTILRFLDDDGDEYTLFFVEFSDFVVVTQLGLAWNEK
ncbi:hypothetical protein ACJJIR_01985 [Microbulbifer sp. SSSA008]|uniref:hypothetical protein n=1 Tax=Microbulbifer sp. SSSA008 TaxID=3243380 RepID=UPI004039C0E6